MYLRNLRGLKTAVLVTMAITLAGCNTMYTSITTSKTRSPHNYVLAGADPFNAKLDAVFACMKATGGLKDQGFAIGPFSNGTGKANAATQGGTGSFLPSGPNFAIYAVEAISRAGGIAYDYSNTDVVRNIAFVGGEAAAKHLQALQNNNMPNFGVNVFATALDFSGADSVDLRIGGAGPLYTNTKANAYYAAHIFQPGSQRSLGRGFAVFQADFTSVGASMSRFFGGATGTLVSGSLSSGLQQPLQRPSAEGIMVAVAFALMEIPALSSCRSSLQVFSPMAKKSSQSNGWSSLNAPPISAVNSTEQPDGTLIQTY
ncbi:MAG: hypothetical protein JKY10_10750 [Cohaesibacteraceae bacterium]|nr:hypothetical protein [Cohaesibacteraceae bacterium]